MLLLLLKIITWERKKVMEIKELKKGIMTKLLEVAKNKECAAKEKSDKTRKRANEEEGAMQSRYSTFKEEGQYLASGLQAIHEDYKAIVSITQVMLNEPIREVSRVETLSIVDVEFENGEKETFFVFPFLGGERINNVLIITPKAPIAKALFKKSAGEEFSFSLGNTIKRGEIIDVR